MPAAIAAVGCVVAPAVASAAPAVRCAAPGPPISKSITRAERPSGPELTEYVAGGGYRVTRCNKDGSLRVSQTVSPIEDPDGGTALVMTEQDEPGVKIAASYGDPDEPSWSADFRATRPARRASLIPPTAIAAQAVGDALVPESASAGAECTAGQYTMWSMMWTSRWYSYQVNRARFNYNDTIVAAITAGHRAWDTTFNDCAYADITNLTSSYASSTSSTVHSLPDGQSVVDKGDLVGLGCPGALACTWLFPSSSGAAGETDQRYNETVNFSTVGASSAYDYQSVATHESGHSIGLDHANSSSALTMYYQIAAGSTQARTLARGDIIGLRTRYP